MYVVNDQLDGSITIYQDELTENGIKEMLAGFLSKKSRNKEINKPFIPIFEIEYKKVKKV